MSVAADVEGFLILGFALLKESFIAGEHIKSLVDMAQGLPRGNFLEAV